MTGRGCIVARRVHRWAGLLVGAQVLVWLSSGLYMVVLDLDFIHGDPLVANTLQTVTVPGPDRTRVGELRSRYPDATAVSLAPIMGKTFYRVTTPTARYLLDPQSGAVVSPLGEAAARDVAAFHYNGDAAVRGASWIAADPPGEIRGQPLPLWRIDFDDRYSTSFYIDPFSGELLTRRHRYWRIFDFMWMLHIMDYRQRTDAHNLLLRTAQVSALVFVVAGLWLLLCSFAGRRRRQEPPG